MAFSVSEAIWSQMVGWLTEDELRRTWKEPVVAISKYYSYIPWGHWEILLKSLSQDSLCLGRDSNQAPRDYKQKRYNMSHLDYDAATWNGVIECNWYDFVSKLVVIYATDKSAIA
jgi:hypothetical protein